MSPKFSKRAVAQPTRLVLCTALALALTACGGGGGSAGSVPGGSNATNPATAEPKATMAILNGTTPITSLSGGQTATVKVTVTNAAGQPAANEVVKFASADGLIVFSPDSASALTDSTGVAVITIKPTTVDSAGATAITATVVVAGKTANAATNLAVGAAPLTLGALSFASTPPAKLPAFSTLQLNIPVTSGGQPATTSNGLVLSSLCAGDGTATLVLGSLANGIQTATYTNNGCVRGSDTVSARIGNTVQSISFGVDSANIGAIQFVGSDLQGQSIVLKGSGGLGRAESSLLTFRVLDQNNQGLAGVDVDFSASTNTGGLTVAPVRGTTDSTGKVTTTVTSGTIPTPVRVFAQATRNGKTISGLSDTLTISTGLPIQKNMSLSAQAYNIEGGGFDGISTDITVRLADQYGNPISDGTAVSFITEGGAIGSSLRGACVTVDGGCSVPLKSQDFRPVNRRVTVLAYVQGVENFVDSNGDGQYTCTNFVSPNGTVPAIYRPLVDTCVSGGEPFTDLPDAFLDAGMLGSVVGLEKTGVYSTLDGLLTAANGDLPVPYNSATYNSAGNGRWGLNYIRTQAEFVFSGSYAIMSRTDCTSGTCVDWAATPAQYVVKTTTDTGCGSTKVSVRLYDALNNPLPYNSTVAIVDTDKVTITTISPNAIPSTSDIGGTIHDFIVRPDAACSAGSFGLKITTPKGMTTLYNFTTI